MMLEAETLVVAAKSSDTAPAELDAEVAAYGKLVDETEAFATAHSDLATKAFGSITNIRNYSKAFLSAAKDVARKRRANEKPTPDELHNVGEQYNAPAD